MYFEKPDGWVLQGRLLAEARRVYERRQPRPTQPIPHFDITFMYFMNGTWHSSKSMPPKPAIMTRRQGYETASRLKP